MSTYNICFLPQIRKCISEYTLHISGAVHQFDFFFFFFFLFLGVKGPLSVLRRCMEEKLKAVVVIRSAVSVRSHCKGYVIAFDKHFNMVG